MIPRRYEPLPERSGEPELPDAVAALIADIAQTYFLEPACLRSPSRREDVSTLPPGLLSASERMMPLRWWKQPGAWPTLRRKGFDTMTIPPDGRKVCTHCQRSLPLDAFHRWRAAPDGYRARCKECRRKTEPKQSRVRVMVPSPAVVPDEEWRPVLGYETLYEVSSAGRVRRACPGAGTGAGYVLRPSAHQGYLYVTLRRDFHSYRCAVHRLVLGAFLGPPAPGNEVNHRDFNRANNHVHNLEYVSRLENMRHALAAGRQVWPVGEQAAAAKLTPRQVQEIRALPAVVSHAAAARRYGVSETTIRAVRHGKRWTHVPSGEAGS
jgi:hypothetical protein